MNRVAALVLVLVALLGIGLWGSFGDAWSDGAGVPPGLERVGEVDAVPPDEPAPAADGYEPVPFLVDEPVQRFDGPEPVLEDGLDYRVAIVTTAGTMTIDLYERRVPETVENFVFLALHRYYEGVAFHRVIDGFMAQTGDPTGTGSGGPGYTFDDEIVDGLVHDRAGLLSMANAGPDTNGSQFFVTFGPAAWLDGRHAVFGEVIDGLDVLDRLTRVDPQAPSVVAPLTDPASSLAEQGLAEAEGAEGTVGDWLEERLGVLPDEGQSFEVAGRRGVLGNVAGAPALGLFAIPDRIESVTVLATPEEDPS